MFEDGCNVGAGAENRFPEVAGVPEAGRCVVDGELGGVETGYDLVPVQRRRDRGAGFGANAVGRGKGLAMAVLKIIQVDFALTLGWAAFDAGDFRCPVVNEACHEFGKHPHLVVVVFGAERDVDVNTGGAGGFGKAVDF